MRDAREDMTEDAAEAREWDARAELDIGVMIGRYLGEHPAPPGSRVARDLDDWSARLQADGQARLQALGRRRLRAAG